jgi:uncharacterized protein YndB with AHSA1/START domain
MNNNLKFDFNVDETNGTVTVVREFAAAPGAVWAAWTTAELLDQWWAPKPFKARTKELDLKPGGRWMYAMVGPDGSEQWCRAIYSEVVPEQRFAHDDAFCDAEGNVTDEFPGSNWTVVFSEGTGTTIVTITIRHKSVQDLQQILKMGFKEGFSMGLGNLDELLAAGK